MLAIRSRNAAWQKSLRGATGLCTAEDATELKTVQDLNSQLQDEAEKNSKNGRDEFAVGIGMTRLPMSSRREVSSSNRDRVDVGADAQRMLVAAVGERHVSPKLRIHRGQLIKRLFDFREIAIRGTCVRGRKRRRDGLTRRSRRVLDLAKQRHTEGGPLGRRTVRVRVRHRRRRVREAALGFDPWPFPGTLVEAMRFHFSSLQPVGELMRSGRSVRRRIRRVHIAIGRHVILDPGGIGTLRRVQEVPA